MTDDRGAGNEQSIEWPYRYEGGIFKGPTEFKLKIQWQFPDFTLDESTIKSLAEFANDAFSAGRKAERERCADIARQHFSVEGIAQEIEKKIRGGQDGE